MYNLLTSELITVASQDGRKTSRSLPGVLADCITGKAASFPAVRAHQGHAWHSFLAQLGVIATDAAGLTSPPDEEDKWLSILQALTQGYKDQSPWHMVVTDMTKPAFMQPPVHIEEQTAKYDRSLTTPDRLDILQTSKNHDVKKAVAMEADPEDWLMALITLQTMQGFIGSGHYGISRMNMGNGNRPAISLAPLGADPAGHIKRDMLALMEFLPELRYNHPDYDQSPSAPALMWLQPWDGSNEDRITLTDLHPLYIEVCRRIRLLYAGPGTLTAVRATSKKARTFNEGLNGVTGDPWAPLEVSKEPKVVTPTEEGFTALRLFYMMLSDNCRPPLLTKPTEDEAASDDSMVLVSRTLVRGKGKTHGYHQNNTIIRPTLKRALAHPEDRRQAVEIVDTMEKEFFKVKQMLRHALRVFAAYGDTETNGNGEGQSGREHPVSDAVITEFEKLVDESFWQALQDQMEAPAGEQEAARDRWLLNGSDGVLDHARTALRQAIDSLPTSAIMRRRAQQETLDLLEGRFRGKSGFPSLFQQDKRQDNRQDNGQDNGRKREEPPTQEKEAGHDARTESAPEVPKDPSGLVANIAGYASQLALHQRGDLAELRRVDPGAPQSQVFHNIMERYALTSEGNADESSWAWLVKNIATNTPAQTNSNNRQVSAHVPWLALGRALADGGEAGRSNPIISPNKLNSLVSAKGPHLLRRLENALALLGKQNIQVDWRPVARLVLAHQRDQQAVAQELDLITRDYYRALRRTNRQAADPNR